MQTKDHQIRLGNLYSDIKLHSTIILAWLPYHYHTVLNPKVIKSILLSTCGCWGFQALRKRLSRVHHEFLRGMFRVEMRPKCTELRIRKSMEPCACTESDVNAVMRRRAAPGLEGDGKGMGVVVAMCDPRNVGSRIYTERQPITSESSKFRESIWPGKPTAWNPWDASCES
jgi:hypothetical protein